MPDVTASKGNVVRPTRQKVIDRIIAAAHQACDNGALDVARSLLTVGEAALGQGSGPDVRKARESLVAAHERLFELRLGSGAFSLDGGTGYAQAA